CSSVSAPRGPPPSAPHPRSHGIPPIRIGGTWSASLSPRKLPADGFPSSSQVPPQRNPKPWRAPVRRGFFFGAVIAPHGILKASHCPPELDCVEHCGGREIAIRQLPEEARLHHVEQGYLHAAVGAFDIGEIAFLQ